VSPRHDFKFFRCARDNSGDRQPRGKTIDYSPLNGTKVSAHGALRSVGIASGDRFGDGPMFGIPLSGPLRIDPRAVAQSQTNVGADLPQ
jgi:hypothetical protein